MFRSISSRAVGLGVVTLGFSLLVWSRPSAVPIVAPPATLVLRHGTVLTLDEARPQAQAVAIRGDRIVVVGSDADVAPLIGQTTRVIDLRGAVAMPGFIESHGHFLGTGEMKLGLDLSTATSWDDVVAQVSAAVTTARPGQWITGRGWHQEKWAAAPQPNVEGFPVHDALSRVSPDNPVVLDHASGHASLANARAMSLAGVTATTANPAGGEILKDAAGRPIGVFRETASSLIDRAREADRARMTAAEREAEARKILTLAAAEALRHGVTTFHDAGVGFDTVDFFRREAEAGRLPIRLYVMLAGGQPDLGARLAASRLVGAAGGMLTVRAIKMLADGALGSRGAWLLEPYADAPGSTGLNTVSMEALRATAELAITHGYQLAVHAIGDRANREVLDVYEATFRAHPDAQDVRWRIEHAQHLSARDIPRFGALGVIPSMQGIHCTSDAPYVLARLGRTRAGEGAYVWQKLIAGGARIPNGTDTPVESMDTIASYYALVTRRQKDGTPFFPEQAMTRRQALEAYTINGAYAGFEEHAKGVLAPGRLADITVLSANLLTVPEAEIRATTVRYTIVGGQVRFEAP